MALGGLASHAGGLSLTSSLRTPPRERTTMGALRFGRKLLTLCPVCQEYLPADDGLQSPSTNSPCCYRVLQSPRAAPPQSPSAALVPIFGVEFGSIR